MKGELVDILLGFTLKMADEIADNPFYYKDYNSYLIPLILFVIFFITIRAVDDFYFNIVTLSWFIFSYFGKSIENDKDKQYWNILFIMTLFLTFYSFSYPLPETSWLILLIFILVTPVNAIENLFSPEETSIRKIIMSFLAIFMFTALYNITYFVSPYIEIQPHWDLRFAYKQSLIMISYVITRFISKMYVYSKNGADYSLTGSDELPLKILTYLLPDFILTKEFIAIFQNRKIG